MKPITREEALTEPFIGNQREQILALLDERDAHWVSFCDSEGARVKAEAVLAESQAREAELRAALEACLRWQSGGPGLSIRTSPSIAWDQFMKDSETVRTALARPADDTALRDLLTKVAVTAATSDDSTPNWTQHIVDAVLRGEK